VGTNQNPTPDPSNGLPQKVLFGSIWVFLLRIIQQVLGLLKIIIVAWILSPTEYGIVVFAILVISIVDTFSQTGIQQALIQKGEDIDEYLDSAWTLSLLRGVLLFLLTLLISPIASQYFGSLQSNEMIQVLSISFFISGMMNIGTIFFQKTLNFRRQFSLDFWPFIGDFSATFFTLLAFQSIWAIVIGILFGNVIKLFLSYTTHPFRPRVSFDFKKLKSLMNFSKHIMFSTIMIFLLMQGDDFYVAKILGISSLGLYQMAYTLSNLPATQVSQVISQVTLPAYCLINKSRTLLKKAYLKVLNVTILISFPISGFLFTLGPDIVLIFFGEQWKPMSICLQILVLFGTIRSVNGTIGPVFLSMGLPAYLSKVVLFQVIIMFILIIPLTHYYAIAGTAMAVLIPNMIAFIIQLIYLQKSLNIKVYEILSKMWTPLIATILSSLTMYCCLTFISKGIFSIIFSSLVGFIIYLICLYFSNLKGKGEEWKIVNTIFHEVYSLIIRSTSLNVRGVR